MVIRTEKKSYCETEVYSTCKYVACTDPSTAAVTMTGASTDGKEVRAISIIQGEGWRGAEWSGVGRRGLRSRGVERSEIEWSGVE